MLHLAEQLLSLLAPPRSLTGQLGAAVTPEECAALAMLTPIVFDASALRRRGVHHIDHVVAGARYGASPLLRAAIRRWKYRGGSAYAGVCSDVLLHATPLLRGRGVLCPVPLHWSRRWWRGFNQATHLANALSCAMDMPISACLQRQKATGAQARRTHEQRRHALDGAFAVRGAVPAHIVLVDDVMTTGVTLDLCALALRRAGCERVEAIVIAA